MFSDFQTGTLNNKKIRICKLYQNTRSKKLKNRKKKTNANEQSDSGVTMNKNQGYSMEIWVF